MAFGSNLVFASKVASTWFTPVHVGAGDGGLLYDNAALNKKREFIPEDSAGIIGLQQAYYGREDESFEQNGALRWANAIPWTHIFLTMGSETVTQQGGTSAYLHSALFDEFTDGKFYTHAARLQWTNGAEITQIREIASVKPTGFTLSSAGDGFCDFSLRGMKSGLRHQTDATNVDGDFDNVTLETNRLKIPFKIANFRINSDAGALDANDKAKISEFELSVDRPYDRDDDAYGNTYAGNEFETNEPHQGGAQPEIILRVNASRYVDSGTWTSSLVDDMANGGDTPENTWKADITFEGAVIASTYKYKLLLEFPLLMTLDSETQISRQSKIGFTHQFRAMKASAAPTGMSGITDYLKLSLINTRTSVYGKA